MKSPGYIPLLLMALLGCSTKKYLPRIFNPDMAKINVNHTTIYYEKAGKGMPIVLIHGFGLDSRMWDAQFEIWSQKYMVIRYDLRGFGQSDLPSESETYTHHEDLKALLDVLGIDQVVLIGLSMGGRVATSFALTYPGRTLGLVLIDSTLEGYTMKNYKMDDIYEEAKKSMPGALKLWLAHPTFAYTNKNPAVAGELSKIISNYSGWHFTHKNPWTPLKPPGIDRLHEIRAPSLILIGEHDLPDFHDIAGILDDKITGSQQVMIPGAGHMCNMEQPKLVNKLIQDFLNKEIKVN